MRDQDDAPGAEIRWLLGTVGAGVVCLTVPIVVAVFWKSSVYFSVLPFWVLAVIFGLQAALCFLPPARVPAEVAARNPGARCPSSDGLEPASRALLRRARDAIRAVTASEVCAAGLLDRAAVSTELTRQESDIATALHDQARIRASRAERTPVSAGPMTAAVSGSQIQATQLAESSITARVEALERYAAQVAEADAVYSDWRQAARLAELHGQHLDMLARTAADEHGIAEIEAMSQRARAVSLILREPPAL